jgi:hypothetical protein
MGERMYSPMYDLINQFLLVNNKHILTPSTENSARPIHIITAYIPKKKNIHWNMKLQNPLIEGFIVNHPDISTKILTLSIAIHSIVIRIIDANGDEIHSKAVGAPRAQ